MVPPEEREEARPLMAEDSLSLAPTLKRPWMARLLEPCSDDGLALPALPAPLTEPDRAEAAEAGPVAEAAAAAPGGTAAPEEGALPAGSAATAG